MRPKNGRASLQDLLADAAGADEAERAAGQTLPHETCAIVPATGLHELVLLEEAAGQRKDHRQRRDRDRPAHGDRRVRDDDALGGRGGKIDVVVADTVAGDDLEPAIVTREAFAVVTRNGRDAAPS